MNRLNSVPLCLRVHKYIIWKIIAFVEVNSSLHGDQFSGETYRQVFASRLRVFMRDIRSCECSISSQKIKT